MSDDLHTRLRVDAADIEGHLAGACLALRRGPMGTTLAIPGHSELAWPQHWLRYFRQHRNHWNFYEEAATLTFSFLLRHLGAKVVFDIGAADGYFARVAASYIDSAPMVHAFELRPTCLDTMRVAIGRDNLDGRVVLHAAALSDRHEGEREIWWCGTKAFEEEPARHEWQPPLWHRIKLAINGEWRVPRKTTVTLTSIDHFVAESGAVPDLIKIDVDGYEGKVLRGGLATFRTHKPAIALELHKDKLIRFGDTRQRIVKMLTDLGYSAYFLTDHQDRKACRVVLVDADHPLVARQETDFIVLH